MRVQRVVAQIGFEELRNLGAPCLGGNRGGESLPIALAYRQRLLVIIKPRIERGQRFILGQHQKMHFRFCFRRARIKHTHLARNRHSPVSDDAFIGNERKPLQYFAG